MMPLTALRRSALVPDQPMPVVNSTWSPFLAAQEGQTIIRPSLFISPLESDIDTSYRWTSSMRSESISPHNIQYSSWETDSQVASTPRQSHHLLQEKNMLPASTDDLMKASTIDQWLHGSTLDVTPSSLTVTDHIKRLPVDIDYPPISSLNLQVFSPLQESSHHVDAFS